MYLSLASFKDNSIQLLWNTDQCSGLKKCTMNAEAGQKQTFSFYADDRSRKLHRKPINTGN